MNKFKIIIFSLFLLTLTGCKKEVITYEDFASIFNDNYTITNMTNKIEGSQVVNAYVSVKNDNSYQIEFYIIESELEAETVYERNYNEVIKNRTYECVMEEKDEYNYSKFTMYDEDKYYVISRVGNTLIYINTNVSNKEEIDSLLNKINY